MYVNTYMYIYEVLIDKPYEFSNSCPKCLAIL